VALLFGSGITVDGEASRPTWARQQELQPPTDMTILSAKLATEPATLA
jgi:hypothetical protein